MIPLIKDWKDIKVGETYRLRNSFNKELDRTIISVNETKRFISHYNNFGVPYVAGESGDRLAAELDPDWDWEEEKQLTLF